jgi:hypothetical protein
VPFVTIVARFSIRDSRRRWAGVERYEVQWDESSEESVEALQEVCRVSESMNPQGKFARGKKGWQDIGREQDRNRDGVSK